MNNKILLTLILVSLSCTKNTKEEQKSVKQEDQELIKQKEPKPVTSYVIVIYNVSYYQLNDPSSNEYPIPDLQMRTLVSKIKEVEDLNDEKKAKLKDEFLEKVNKLLQTKNNEYFEDIAAFKRKNKINRTYNSPYTLEKSKIEGLKERKTEIYERTIKVFDTYNEASDFRFKFN